TPVPNLTATDVDALSRIAHREWSIKRRLDTRTETSHAFALPALLQVEGETLTDRAAAWNERAEEIEDELTALQAEIDEISFTLYGIAAEDRRSITGRYDVGSSVTCDDGPGEEDAVDGDQVKGGAETTVLAIELASWGVGTAFGRFDIWLGT